MTLSAVAVDGAITASLHNEIIAHVNTSRGRAVFTADGTWSIPAGVHNFIVYLAGGGGDGGDGYHVSGDAEFDYDGGPGGNAPLCSKVFSGLEIGTSYSIVIGAGGAAGTGDTGGSSVFGSGLLTSTGGVGGPTFPTTGSGARGTHTGTLAHGNEMFVNSAGLPYGSGGAGGHGGVGEAGVQGVCVIEW